MKIDQNVVIIRVFMGNVDDMSTKLTLLPSANVNQVGLEKTVISHIRVPVLLAQFASVEQRAIDRSAFVLWTDSVRDVPCVRLFVIRTQMTLATMEEHACQRANTHHPL